MKRFVYILAFSLILLIFQTAIFSRIFIYTPRPNIFLILLVYMAIENNAVFPLFWVVIMGLFTDFLSGGPIGLFSFQYLIIYLIIKTICKFLTLKLIVLRTLSVFGAHLLQIIIFISTINFLSISINQNALEIGYLFLGAFGAAFLSLLFYPLLDKIGYY